MDPTQALDKPAEHDLLALLHAGMKQAGPGDYHALRTVSQDGEGYVIVGRPGMTQPMLLATLRRTRHELDRWIQRIEGGTSWHEGKGEGPSR